WNSTYNTLKFVHSYQDLINQMTDCHSLKLEHCSITELEWELVKQLWNALKGIRKTHLFLTDTPCLVSVILAMDKMHDKLTKAMQNENYSSAL
ncbi:hypothetical protein BGW80DRAFT_1174312, partial [Lactifluus volemus]